jgi:hypothetical protein
MIRNTIAALILLIIATAFTRSEKNEVAISYANSITADDLSKHLNVLASDEYEGRETGKAGQKKAAKYIADYFAGLGMKPVVGDSYYQQFPLEIIDPMGVSISIGDEEYEFLKDFYYFPGFGDRKINTEDIMFIGYGIDDKKYSDYEGVDVTGKVLLFLDKEPVGKDGKSLITGGKRLSSWSTNWTKKLGVAESKGASAALVVVDDIGKRIDRVRRFVGKPTMQLAKEKAVNEDEILPNFYISESMANAILNPSNRKLKKIKRKIASGKGPLHFDIKQSIEIDLNRGSEQIFAENVLGYLEGTDKKDELVIITAHYDHIGMDGDKVFNGADDDGSGTVAVLELAQAFAKAKTEGNGPRRSMLFMTVSGEEQQLLGSKYYADHPIFPLETTVVDLNIDMIGRIDDNHEGNGDYIYLIGADKLSTELHEISEEANALYTDLELDYTFNSDDDPNRFYYRSDHYSFAKNGIPVIFYFNGTHDDYHKETDTVEKINFAKMEKITRLVFHTAWELANREERIIVDKEPEKAE